MDPKKMKTQKYYLFMPKVLALTNNCDQKCSVINEEETY